jgi:hypothetical protein
MQEATKRKRRTRSDRRHVVYRLVHPPTGGSYIGITAVIDRSPDRSVRKRWTQHLWHARSAGREGPLADLIRSRGDDPWLVQVVEVVKGKAAAHAVELQLIRDESPTLNTEGTARKRRAGQRQIVQS